MNVTHSNRAHAQYCHCCGAPVEPLSQGSMYCPQCGVRLQFDEAELHVTGNSATEVLKVLTGFTAFASRIGLHKGSDNAKETDLRWERFLANARDVNDDFERLCGDLFRLEYFDETTVFRRVPNNPGVEVHPQEASKGEFAGKLVSYQSKFFTGAVNYSQIVDSVEKTIKYYCPPDSSIRSIEVIVLYCNRVISQSAEVGICPSNNMYAAIEQKLRDAGVILKAISSDELIRRIRLYPELAERYFHV